MCSNYIPVLMQARLCPANSVHCMILTPTHFSSGFSTLNPSLFWKFITNFCSTSVSQKIITNTFWFLKNDKVLTKIWSKF